MNNRSNVLPILLILGVAVAAWWMFNSPVTPSASAPAGVAAQPKVNVVPQMDSLPSQVGNVLGDAVESLQFAMPEMPSMPEVAQVIPAFRSAVDGLYQPNMSQGFISDLSGLFSFAQTTMPDVAFERTLCYVMLASSNELFMGYAGDLHSYNDKVVDSYVGLACQFFAGGQSNATLVLVSQKGQQPTLGYSVDSHAEGQTNALTLLFGNAPGGRLKFQDQSLGVYVLGSPE
ncbi:hypothetical protein CO180_04435 [candidate division WWE3 bacterium CG_4_9_14_3_um_filter_41_6]|uniref:Uncharacterized protein n=1 Tax=candidate division WWE3 bacterium CG_4_10_14_0_2_um_filter_41_14 TaxID=1975072 RepID=A0A2M7TF51_UNCKA|nr:MAG: hypothetical protein COY32_06330 [candidate division WWE3 bacterium CG_4_10_14_0_2_um_filter_41_14]PJA38041.1 MAG: hypothetical protein CO180_04435 [candidate division WWE3 bacterium CG_4_9_14_3_um_filter_41_6]